VDYKKDTLDAYQSADRAKEYKKFHTKQFSWGRLVTLIEQWIISKELKKYKWSASDKLLDIPCGTGILGSVLHDFPFEIFASDISIEMMEYAKNEYPSNRLVEFTQQDITNTGFKRGSFSCVITLGFLHRVPLDIKRETLREIFELTNNIAIVTCSVDNPIQRLKHKILSIVKKDHVPAPCPIKLKDLISECEDQGFYVRNSLMVLPLLSSHGLLVLQK